MILLKKEYSNSHPKFFYKISQKFYNIQSFNLKFADFISS
jgi:hypothetical protein